MPLFYEGLKNFFFCLKIFTTFKIKTKFKLSFSMSSALNDFLLIKIK